MRGDISALAREAPDGHGGDDAAGVADNTDKATLQRLLSLTPNLKLIVRDVSHTSRRVTAKPEAAGKYLAELTRHIFTGKHRIA